MFNNLHNELVAAIETIRERASECNIGHFNFTVTCSGRTATDRADVRLEYRLGDYDTHAKGGELNAVLIEWCRRIGWDKANAPLALPKPRRKTRTDAVTE